MLRIVALALFPTIAFAQDAVFAGTVAGPTAEGSALVGTLVSGEFEVEVNGQTLSLQTTDVERDGAVKKWTAAGDGVVLTFTVTAKKGWDPALDMKMLKEAWVTVDVAGTHGAVHRTSAQIERLVARRAARTASVTVDSFDDSMDDAIDFAPTATAFQE